MIYLPVANRQCVLPAHYMQYFSHFSLTNRFKNPLSSTDVKHAILYPKICTKLRLLRVI